MPTTLPLPEVEEQTSVAEQRSPLYNVVLFDDDEHSYAYVVEMIMTLFGMTAEEGFNVAYNVDHIGQAVVLTADFDRAVESQKKIISYGPDYRLPNSKGSMGATVEPAGE
jgi:ATP-dependent Clp protease adaptor protein ClpS